MARCTHQSMRHTALASTSRPSRIRCNQVGTERYCSTSEWTKANPSHPSALIPSSTEASFTMDIAEDLALIARQEAELLFPSFDYDTAWRLGVSLRVLSLSLYQ